jgi:hypothetical protein
MNISEKFSGFFQNWNWKHYIHFLFPFFLPFIIGFPTPLISWIDLISTTFDKVNYLNGLIVSFFIMTIGLFFTWGTGGQTTKSYTGKSYESDRGEVFREYEEHYSPSTDDIWTWSKIHKTIFKFHFISLLITIVIKYLL